VTVLAAAMRYVNGRRARGEIAAGTARSFMSVLSRFAAATRNRTVSGLTRRHVERFLEGADVRPATAALYLAVLRTFGQWLFLEGMVRRDPTIGVKGPRKPRAVPRGLRGEDVDAIFHHCPDTRARLIVSLMVQEGLRCSEVAGLKLGDVDLVDRTLFIVGKGGHERVLPLTQGSAVLAGRYLSEHPTSAGPLIRSYLNPLKGITPNRVSVLVGEWMGDAGVRGRVRDGRSAHALRHTCASDLARAGVDVVVVQGVLGHASLATTSRYVGRAGLERMRTAMAGRDYRTTRTVP
jgi:site-specific recombinase XerD